MESRLTGIYASTTRHTESPCLNCGKRIDAASVFGVGEDAVRPPGEGDITICLHCRHVMAYTADLTLRALTDEEVVDIAGDPRLVSSIELMGAYAKDKELATRRRENRSQAGDEKVSRQVHRQARRAAIAFLKASRRTVSRPE